MSNQFLKLRRSSVPGKVPTTSSLEFGEIALNTYDGLAFIKKSGSNGEEIVTIGSTTGNLTGSLFGTASWAINALTASSADDNFIIRGSLTGSDAFFTGTITAQRLFVQYVTSSTAYVTGSTIFGSQLTDTHQFTGSVSITGSLTVEGPLYATSSWATNALTASYALNAGTVVTNQITSGSVTASVNIGYDGIFLIKSGSTNFFEISGSGESTLQSSIFIIKNFVTQEEVLIVSESTVRFATQSFDPISPTKAGSFWFTSTDLYVGLE